MRKSFLEYCFAMVRELEASADNRSQTLCGDSDYLRLAIGTSCNATPTTAQDVEIAL